MQFKFSVKQVCAAIAAAASAFSVAYYSVPHPITAGGWATIVMALIPAIVGTLFVDPAPTKRILTLFR